MAPKIEKVASILLLGFLVIYWGGYRLLLSWLSTGVHGVTLHQLNLFSTIASCGLFATYLWWLYLRRAVRSWLAPTILLGCSILTLLVNNVVYQYAEVVSYIREEGMISERVFYRPEYAGEEIPFAVLFLSPFAGVIFLIFFSFKGQRGQQLLQYIALLFFVYPITFIFLLGAMDSKPRYYVDGTLPADLAAALRAAKPGDSYRVYTAEH